MKRWDRKLQEYGKQKKKGKITQRGFLPEQSAIDTSETNLYKNQFFDNAWQKYDDLYESCTIDSEIMEKKSFIARLNKVSSPDGDYLVIYRANGNFRAFNYLMEVLHIFDRQDLYHLYNLMMEQYSEITLEGIELILWGDLKIMMESSTEENGFKVISGVINKIGRLSLRDCMKLVEFTY
ncbi:hypothetical protein Tco_0969368 [Tanacetum coccineum]